MKRKFLALTALTLCLAMLLCSCAMPVNFKSVINSDLQPEVEKVPSTAGLIELEKIQEYGYNDLHLFYTTDYVTWLNSYVVYNVATGTYVWSGTETVTESFDKTVSVYYEPYFETVYVNNEAFELLVVEKETETESDASEQTTIDVTVYDEKGSVIASLNNTPEYTIWSAADLICIQNKVYRVSANGTVSYVFDFSYLKDIPYDIVKVGDYYLDISSGEVIIYDDKLNVTTVYHVPDYQEDDENIDMDYPVILSNGNVLVQYLVRQDDMADKYELLYEGKKYDLKSILIEAKSGKIKELSLDYVIGYVLNNAEASQAIFNAKIENVAIAVPIEDKRVNMSESAIQLLSFSNSGKVKGVVKMPVENGVFFTFYAKDRWAISTSDDRVFLTDAKGTVLGEISGMDHSYDSYLVAGNAIYDWDLNLKLDLSSIQTENVYYLNNSVAYETDKGEVLLYTANGTQTLISQSLAQKGTHEFIYLTQNAYMIIDDSDDETMYRIYNENGVLITTITDVIDTPYVCCEADNGAFVLRTSNEDGDAVYYRIS